MVPKFRSARVEGVLEAGRPTASCPAAKRGSRVAVAGLLALLAVAACDRIGGRTVMVEFNSAGGVRSGERVYFAGVEVGRTGSPSIVKGKARVPVNLFRSQRDALPAGAVFAVGDDPRKPGTQCLQGYAVAAVPHRAEDDTEVYQGVSNEFELTLLLGAQKAREFMEQLNR